MRIISTELEVSIETWKKWLFNGDIKRIARETGKSEIMVSFVVNKRRFNPEVVKAVREKAIKNAKTLGVELS